MSPQTRIITLVLALLAAFFAFGGTPCAKPPAPALNPAAAALPAPVPTLAPAAARNPKWAQPARPADVPETDLPNFHRITDAL